MNLVDGVTTFPVPVGNNASLARSEDAACCMAAVGWGDLAAVVAGNLSITRHWGQGGLETNENILSTLQALVEGTHHLPADNRLGTFQMFLQVPGQTHDVGTFIEHLECNINMCNTFDPP